MNATSRRESTRLIAAATLSATHAGATPGATRVLMLTVGDALRILASTFCAKGRYIVGSIGSRTDVNAAFSTRPTISSDCDGAFGGREINDWPIGFALGKYRRAKAS